MALTGTLLADFSDFQDACAAAEVSLKGFETGASKVEQQLTRMTDSISGVKVVQQATLMAEAVERIGGVSKLTEDELVRLGTTAQEAVDKLRALGQDVPAGLQKLADASREARAANEEHGLSVKDLITSYISAEAIIGAVKAAWEGLVGFLRDSIKAASDAQDAHQHLVAALQAQGIAVPYVIDAYERYSAAIQKTTIYQDDAAESAAALLTQIGKVGPDQMELALKATTDLASALGIDLQSAAMMVSKAAEGQTTALRKAGIVLDEATKKSGDFHRVLVAIEGQLHGTAEAMAGTFSGQLHQFANEWNNVEEAVGGVITKNQTVLTLMQQIDNAFRDNSGRLQDNKAANDAVSAAIIFTVKSIDLLLSALDFVQGGYQGARKAVDEWAASVTRDSAMVLESMYAIARLSEGLNPLSWTSAWQSAMNTAQDSIATLAAYSKGFSADAQDAATSAASFGDKVAGLHTWLNNTVNALEGTRGKVRDASGAMTDFVGPINKVTEGTRQLTEEEKALQAELVKTFEQQLAAAEKISAANRQSYGYEARIAAIDQLIAREREMAKAVYDQLDSEKDRAKVIDDLVKHQIDLENQKKKAQQEQMQFMNGQVQAELDAREKINAAYGQNVQGMVPLNDAYETLKKKTDELNLLRAQGIDVTERQILADMAFTAALQKEAEQLVVVGHGIDDIRAALPGATMGMDGFTGSMNLGIATLAEYNAAITAFYDSLDPGVGHLTGANAGMAEGVSAGLLRMRSPNAPTTGIFFGGSRDVGGPVSPGQSYYVGKGAQPELFTPSTPGFMTPAGKGATVNNTINIVDTEANLARRVSDAISRSILQSTKLGAS